MVTYPILPNSQRPIAVLLIDEDGNFVDASGGSSVNTSARVWTHQTIALDAAAVQTVLAAGQYHGVYIENKSPFAGIALTWNGEDATLAGDDKVLAPGESLEWRKSDGDMPASLFSAIAAEAASLFVSFC